MKRRLEPDNRKRWDDPELPFYNAKGKPMEPERARQGFERLMEHFGGPPNWRHDPTYNLRKPK